MAPRLHQRRRGGASARTSRLARWAVLGTLLLREAACFSAPRRRPPPAASVVGGTQPPLRTRRPLGDLPRGRRFLGASNDDDDFLGGGVGSETNETERSPSRDEDGDEAGHLPLGYGVASAANAAAGLSLLWSAGSIGRSAVGPSSLSVPLGAAGQAAAAARHQPGLLPTYTSGALFFLLLSGVCSVLSGAAGGGRMRSRPGAYRRITFGTMLCGTVGLLSLPGEAGRLLDETTRVRFVAALIATVLARLLTASVSFAGWEHSCSEDENGFGAGFRERAAGIAGEVARGCRRIRETLPVSEERPASAYRSFFIFSVIGNLFFNVPELVFNLQNSGGRLFSLSASLTVASMARLCLLSTLLLVLKDAAERKRLEGSTAIKLNLLIGLWSLGVGVSQGLGGGPGGTFSVRRAADKLLFGIVFLNNGAVSLLSRLGVIENREVTDPDADPPLRIVF